MRELPSGIVTFLFTDIEGSTRLLDELGPEGYARAFAEHRRLLRHAFDAHGGVEVDTQGDAFFVAFPDAGEAVSAASEAQQALDPGPIRVRMALHSGEPVVTGEGYVGIDVHRAARICSTAHGGQVVISARTQELLDGDTELADLGSHRLKDLGPPEKLFQLGDRTFPPLRSLNATNLPAQPSPLVGRERELEEVQELLRERRLVTLTGAGGSGKTRLGLQVAAELVEEFKDGVFWVPLSALTDAEFVLPSIGATLGASDGAAELIDEKHMLLLLDNLEQILACGPALGELLASCPNLRLLATSRAVLRLAAETEYAVEPLPNVDAVALFRERAVQAEPLEAVREICGRLDGLPLAIELAAARTRVLSPEKLLERLERRLPLLTGGVRDAPERQRTLRATIEWSYDLLSFEEAQLFARLSVFEGSFELEGAEQVCAADLETLESLLEQSLLRRTDEGRSFYLETIRELALEKLEASGEAGEMRRRHAEFYFGLVRAANLSADSAGDEDQEIAGRELHNLRAALDWTLQADPEFGLRLAVAMENFWVAHEPSEGVRWFKAFLDEAPSGPPELRARGLRAYGGVLQPAGDGVLAERLYEEALPLFEALGDDWNVAHLLMRLGHCAFYRQDFRRARDLAAKSLAMSEESGNRNLAQALSLMGEVEYALGNHAAGVELVERSAAVSEELGFAWWQSRVLRRLADWALERDDVDAAYRALRRCLPLSQQLGDRMGIVFALARLARIASATGRPRRAGRHWGAIEAEEQRGSLGAWHGERDKFARPVLVAIGPEFERGREQGRALSLDEAIEDALRGEQATG